MRPTTEKHSKISSRWWEFFFLYYSFFLSETLPAAYVDRNFKILHEVKKKVFFGKKKIIFFKSKKNFQ